MPIYRYRCAACEHELELIHSWEDYAPSICPACGEEKLDRVMGKSNFKLSGKGWYKDGYSSKKDSPASKD